MDHARPVPRARRTGAWYVGEVFGSCASIRQRAVELDREARQPGRTVGHRRARDGGQIARAHRCSPHVGHRDTGRDGDRLDHDAFERALAQLTGQQTK
jgi:hypothetical protein